MFSIIVTTIIVIASMVVLQLKVGHGYLPHAQRAALVRARTQGLHSPEAGKGQWPLPQPHPIPISLKEDSTLEYSEFI